MKPVGPNLITERRVRDPSIIQVCTEGCQPLTQDVKSCTETDDNRKALRTIQRTDSHRLIIA
jgi:hypothetical protein